MNFQGKVSYQRGEGHGFSRTAGSQRDRHEQYVNLYYCSSLRLQHVVLTYLLEIVITRHCLDIYIYC